jgi:hypothetical protein
MIVDTRPKNIRECIHIMGWLSWIAQNSGRSILIFGLGSALRPSRTCYMWDNTGRRWREDGYEGYGVFGGKDYFVLLAEMNKNYPEGATNEEKRRDGLKLDEGCHPDILYPNLTDCAEWTWRNISPIHCPHQGGFIAFEHDYNEIVSEICHKRGKRDGWENGKTRPKKIDYTSSR